MSQANSLERLMLELINAERTSRGYNPLQLELRLNDAAEDYSEYMLEEDFFSHTGLDGSDPGDRMRDAGFVFSGSWTWGENIAWQSERGAAGFEDDVANLHQSLMNSSGHRANILNPNFEVIGIGIEIDDYTTSSGRTYEAVMVTQNFARTSAPLQIDNDDSGGGNDDTGNEPPLPSPLPPLPPEDLELTGDGGANTLTGDSGDDTLTGRGGNDALTGNAGQDTIWGGNGNDTILGGSDSDQIGGGGNNDRIRGGDGNDRIWGGAGNDTAHGDDGNDEIRGGGGRDALWGLGGNDRIYGGGGDDTAGGGAGQDVMSGGAGNDLLYGGSGNDTLNGDNGNDTLRGGADSDIFVFSDGIDQVIDFGAGDRIDLSNVDEITSFSDLQSSHLSGESEAVISDGLGNTLTLLGVGEGALDAGDFIF